jgi:hypothetical protein
VKETEKAAAPFGIRLVVVEAGGRNYERAFSMKKSSSLWRSTAHPPYTRGAATWRRTGGSLMARGTIFELSRCVASYSDRVFKAAKALGLTIQQSLLLQADQVIE